MISDGVESLLSWSSERSE